MCNDSRSSSVCQELGENWDERFLSSLSSDSNNEGADSDDEEIFELDDLQAPEPLKVKSYMYSEASPELNHVSVSVLESFDCTW